MNKHNILFIGLDAHKIAHIEDHYGAKPNHHGRVKQPKVQSLS